MLRVLRGVVGEVLSERELAARICRACVAGLDVQGAAISLLTATSVDGRRSRPPTPPRPRWRTCSSPWARARASRPRVRPSGAGFRHPRPRPTARWPMFAGAVAEQTDVRALFALPLQLGAINLGVLDLYRTTPGPLRRHELRDVLAAADAATLMLLAVPGLPMTTTSDGAATDGRAAQRPVCGRGQRAGGPAVTEKGRAWWDGLWNDRAEVHQATGMVLAQLGVPAQDAFVRLCALRFRPPPPAGRGRPRRRRAPAGVHPGHGLSQDATSPSGESPVSGALPRKGVPSVSHVQNDREQLLAGRSSSWPTPSSTTTTSSTCSTGSSRTA